MMSNDFNINLLSRNSVRDDGQLCPLSTIQPHRLTLTLYQSSLSLFNSINNLLTHYVVVKYTTDTLIYGKIEDIVMK